MSTDRLAHALSDRYTIERELGAGGMATVYLAHDLKHDRKVAIKVLRPELAAVLGAERFVQEIKTTAALSHPHILPLFDSGQVMVTQDAQRPGPTAQAILFYVMPYIEGETVREKLNRETQFGIDESVRITTEVADALDYAHRHGVIHRDIKPENILLHDGRPMVMDFGIALAVSAAAGGRMTETGLSLGTPHYMSPEQATADREITGRSDIYSLGTVLYEMLAGDPPHTGSSAQQIIMKIVTEDAAPVTRLRKSVPTNVAAAVSKSLEKLPADRFATGKDFADALSNPGFAAVATPAVGAASIDARRLQGWIRSRWSWAALAVVAGMVIALAARRTPAAQAPTFTAETFTPRSIFNARFGPDGQTIVFSGTPGSGTSPRLFVIRPDHPDPEPFGPDSTHLLSISSSGVAAVLTHAQYLSHRLFTGTLATLPLSGGAPRELAVGVREADWGPDGTTMAVIRDTNGADQLEYPVGTVIARSGGYLSDVRISPSGDAVAYFDHPARYDDRGSAVIIGRAGRTVAHSDQFWGLEGLAWRPNGRSILFSGSAASYSDFAVRDLSRTGQGKLVVTGAGGLTVEDASRSGALLVTRDEEPSLLEARGPGAAEATNLGVRDVSDTPLLSADGTLLAFSDQGSLGGPDYTVLLRKTDGSPEVRLGDGEPLAISLDGKFVLANVPSKPPRLMLYPTGPGASRQLHVGMFESIAYNSGSLVAVDHDLRFTFCGARPHGAMRCYVASVGDTTVTPITPEGTTSALLSPDGARILSRANGGWQIYPAAGGAPQPALGFHSDDNLIRWSPDGHEVWVTDQDDSMTIHVARVNPATGARAELERIVPRAQAGLMGLDWTTLANDPHVYAYVEFPYLSQLYLVRGVK